MEFFNRLLGRNAPVTTSRPGWPPAPQPQYPAAWSTPKAKPPVTPGVGLKGAGRLLGPVGVGIDIYQTGRQVFNPQDNIITRLGALGNSIENVIGSGGGVPKKSKPSQKRPDGYSSYGTYTVGGIEYDINSGRPTYMPAGSVYPSSSVAPFVPAQGQAPGRGPGPTPQPIPQISPEERAYNEERSRIAQLTAQNPEFQNISQLRNDLRDQGMAIWQQKYGGTPMSQPGGAVGSFNPLMDRTFGYQTGMSPAQMAEMQKTAAPIQVAPGQVPYQQGDLGTRATLETGYDPAAFGLTPEKIEEMKKQLLQQASK
jgi:hypothetical protein